MTKLKIVTGKQAAVVRKALFIQGELITDTIIKDVLKESSYTSNMVGILKDLSRNAFLKLNDKTYDDYVRDWINSPSRCFTQGYHTSQFYTLLLQNFIALHPGFITFITNERMKDDEIKSPDSDGLTTEQRKKELIMAYRHTDHLTTVSFSYYNDRGILCGVHLTCSKLDPTLWVASVARNTPAEINNMDVLVITPSNLMDAVTQEVEEQSAAETFLNFLDSEFLKTKLNKELFQDGKIDLDMLKALVKLVDEQPETPEQSKIVKEKQSLFEKLSEEKKKKISAVVAKYSPQDSNHAPTSSFLEKNKELFLSMILVGIGLSLTGFLTPLGILAVGALFIVPPLLMALKKGWDKVTMMVKNVYHRINQYLELRELEKNFEVESRSLLLRENPIMEVGKSEEKPEEKADVSQRLNELPEELPPQKSSALSAPSRIARSQSEPNLNPLPRPLFFRAPTSPYSLSASTQNSPSDSNEPASLNEQENSFH